MTSLFVVCLLCAFAPVVFGDWRIAYNGTLNTTATSAPGPRSYYSSTTDVKNNIYIFGGFHPTQWWARFNDLWLLEPNGNWTLLYLTRRSSTGKTRGVFPSAPGISGPEYYPGTRQGAALWMDSSKGILYMFGGFGNDDGSTGCDLVETVYGCSLNDFWSFNIANRTWTWLGGNRGGETGPSSTSTIPSSRMDMLVTSDSMTGVAYLFGGERLNPWRDDWYSSYFADLWRFQPPNTWTRLSGSSTYLADSYDGVYVNRGSESSSAYPAARANGISWIDGSSLYIASGFRMLGSQGRYRDGTTLNDMWMFNLNTSRWTWTNFSTPALSYSSSAYDSQTKKLYSVYPSSRYVASNFQDVPSYIFEDSTFRQLDMNPVPQPSPRDFQQALWVRPGGKLWYWASTASSNNIWEWAPSNSTSTRTATPTSSSSGYQPSTTTDWWWWPSSSSSSSSQSSDWWWYPTSSSSSSSSSSFETTDWWWWYPTSSSSSSSSAETTDWWWYPTSSSSSSSAETTDWWWYPTSESSSSSSESSDWWYPTSESSFPSYSESAGPVSPSCPDPSSTALDLNTNVEFNSFLGYAYIDILYTPMKGREVKFNQFLGRCNGIYSYSFSHGNCSSAISVNAIWSDLAACATFTKTPTEDVYSFNLRVDFEDKFFTPTRIISQDIPIEIRYQNSVEFTAGGITPFTGYNTTNTTEGEKMTAILYSWDAVSPLEFSDWIGNLTNEALIQVEYSAPANWNGESLNYSSWLQNCYAINFTVGPNRGASAVMVAQTLLGMSYPQFRSIDVQFLSRSKLSTSVQFSSQTLTSHTNGTFSVKFDVYASLPNSVSGVWLRDYWIYYSYLTDVSVVQTSEATVTSLNAHRSSWTLSFGLEERVCSIDQDFTFGYRLNRLYNSKTLKFSLSINNLCPVVKTNSLYGSLSVSNGNSTELQVEQTYFFDVFIGSSMSISSVNVKDVGI